MLRRLVESDLDQCLEIEQAVQPKPWTVDMFAAEIRNPAALTLGLELDSSLIAFCICHKIVDELHLLNFAVIPSLQSKGLGSLLLARTLQEATNLFGPGLCLLEVRESNYKAIKLYEKFGGSLVGVRRNYYPDSREDAQLYNIAITQELISHLNDLYPL